MTDLTHDFEPDTATPVDPIPEFAPPPGQIADADSKRKSRKRRFLLLGGAVALGLAGYGGYTLLSGDSESTDDAYVAGDVVAITARDAGNVVALHADDTQSVRRGEPLIDLDPATADAELAAAEAKLGQAVRSVRSAFSRVDETGAEIGQAAAELSRAQDDLARRRQAAADGAVSGEEVAHAADSVRTASAALALAQSRRAQAASTVQGTNVATNPDVLEAIAAYRRAAIFRSHMHITAPVDGVIAKRGVQLGQQVSPGTPLMAVVPLKRVWIDANFRETQLADLRVGQPVTITADAYGSRVTFHGKVEGLGAGSGSAFALLPAQNASGNWIKIVQRVPVRIALDPRELDRNPLRIGLSVTVEVDTHDHSGIPVARAAVRNFQSQQSDDGGAEVERRIAAIVAANMGRRAQ